MLINGSQHGTVSLGSGAKVTVNGSIHGTTTVESRSTLIVEAGGKLAGVLNNYGRVILRGVFGGPRYGDGEFIIEGQGHVKQPAIRDGISFYEW